MDRFGFNRIILALMVAERRYSLDNESRSLDVEYIGSTVSALFTESN